MAGAAGFRFMVMTILSTYQDYWDVVRAHRKSFEQTGHNPEAIRVSEITYVQFRSDGVDAVADSKPYQINYRTFARRIANPWGCLLGSRIF